MPLAKKLHWLDPDIVSYAAVVVAAGTGWCFYKAAESPNLLLVAIFLTLLRMTLNTIDGIMAIQRGKHTLTGEIVNAFPFSRTDSIRPSLEHCARLLDRGWSILIYPEGTRSITGQMGPFKSGVGLMAVELGVPVVPVNISGTYQLLPKGRAIPRRG
jgi:hypothetical protein